MHLESKQGQYIILSCLETPKDMQKMADKWRVYFFLPVFMCFGFLSPNGNSLSGQLSAVILVLRFYKVSTSLWYSHKIRQKENFVFWQVIIKKKHDASGLLVSLDWFELFSHMKCLWRSYFISEALGWAASQSWRIIIMSELCWNSLTVLVREVFRKHLPHVISTGFVVFAAGHCFASTFVLVPVFLKRRNGIAAPGR